MATSPIQPFEKNSILLQAIPWKLDGDAFLLPVSGFPVPDAELTHLRTFLRNLSGAILRNQSLSLEVFVQVAQLSVGDGIARFSAHSREWKAKMGLGVWPDRQPPTIWTKEEFLELGPDERPRRLVHQLFRIGGTTDVRQSAHDCMLGIGVVMNIITRDETKALLEKGKAALFPHITDPSFRSFSYYLPLLDRNSLLAGNAQQLDNWLCGSSFYIRESFEDKGILIASRDRLKPVLDGLGELSQSGGDWHLTF
jgi:hypothetical protein